MGQSHYSRRTLGPAKIADPEYAEFARGIDQKETRRILARDGVRQRKKHSSHYHCAPEDL